ncbi:major facilitator superfamily protein [Clostridium tepidiprofundi DSM 19306]|uniref:Major facilitator superfamily protein n=2 Tax=Clostridium TaxID=1485 RepID=A0A151ASI0_9CLOT|nr:major facilitator superfamily protein [Clostridium tepidiprofundi DSM 19306]
MKNIKRNKITNIAIFYTIVMGLFQFSDKMFGVSYMLVLNDQGLSVRMIGFLVGFQEFVLLIVDYPSGVISDYIGRKKVAGISLILYGVGLLIFAISSNIPSYFLAFALLAISMAMFSGSPQSWFYDTMVKLDVLSEREKLMPKMSGVVSGFSIVSTFIATWLIYKSIFWPLYLGAIVSVISGLAFLFVFEDNKGKLENDNIISVIKEFTKSFFSDGRMRSMVVFEMMNYTSYSVFILVWQLCLMNKYNLEEKYVTFVFIALMFALMVGNFLSGLVLKITSLFNTTYFGKGLIVFSLVILLVFDNMWFTIASFILFDIGLSISGTTISIWKNDYISSNNRATYYSAISSVQSIFSIVVTVLIGILVNKIGYSIAWIIAIVFEIGSILGLAYFIRIYSNMKEIEYY